MIPVILTPSATADLAAAWLDAADPAAVTAASRRADVVLGDDPFGRSRYISEGLWPLDVAPLAYLFDTDPSRSVVRVTQISLLTTSTP
jgi:hypothetical protein